MLCARLIPVALVLSLWAGSPPALGHGGDDDDDGDRGLKGESRLLPPEGGPQPEARGEVEVEVTFDLRNLEIDQEFEVEVQGADPTRELGVFLIGEGGVEESLGTLPAGNGEIGFDTNEGATLPFGAANVALLAGFTVEVRDADAAVVLTGTVPELGRRDDDDEHDDDDDDDDDGHDDDDDDDEQELRGRSNLMRADSSPFADAEGKVEVEIEGDEQELEIEAEHLDAGTTVEFFLDDGSGTPASIGTDDADDEGEAEIEFDTEDGGALPFGAASVADLAGRRVEVRLAADGTLILFGEVPQATEETVNDRCRGDVQDDDSAARVRIFASANNQSGRERLRFEMKKIVRGPAEAELLLDDGAGTLTLVDTVRIRRSGRGWLRFDTKRGDPLPLGAESVRDLEGRAFEIRVDGAAVLAGNLPQF